MNEVEERSRSESPSSERQELPGDSADESSAVSSDGLRGFLKNDKADGGIACRVDDTLSVEEKVALLLRRQQECLEELAFGPQKWMLLGRLHLVDRADEKVVNVEAVLKRGVADGVVEADKSDLLRLPSSTWHLPKHFLAPGQSWQALHETTPAFDVVGAMVATRRWAPQLPRDEDVPASARTIAATLGSVMKELRANASLSDHAHRLLIVAAMRLIVRRVRGGTSAVSFAEAFLAVELGGYALWGCPEAILTDRGETVIALCDFDIAPKPRREQLERMLAKLLAMRSRIGAAPMTAWGLVFLRGGFFVCATGELAAAARVDAPDKSLLCSQRLPFSMLAHVLMALRQAPHEPVFVDDETVPLCWRCVDEEEDVSLPQKRKAGSEEELHATALRKAQLRWERKNPLTDGVFFPCGRQLFSSRMKRFLRDSRALANLNVSEDASDMDIVDEMGEQEFDTSWCFSSDEAEV